MRIAHIVVGGEVAGGQMVALQLARAARRAGHDVIFVSPTDGPFLGLVHREGFAADVVPIRGALDVVAFARLTRTFRTRKIDVVHTHGHFAVNVVSRVAARLAGARVLAHMHIENVFREGLGRGIQVATDNATARLCFAIVAVSEATRTSLLLQGYPRTKVITVYNGVAPPSPVEPVRLASGPIVLEVARLAPVKGQRTLLRALVGLDATAVLVGRDLETDGRYERTLRKEAERLGIAERVVFAGYREDVPALLAGCDIFCLPSSAEGLPLVVLEAMVQAKPVVATSVGGTAELVVDGTTGALVPPADADALRVALAELLADPERARRLGEAGRTRVEREFSFAAFTAHVLDLYAP